MLHYLCSFISSIFHISIEKSFLKILCCLQAYASNSTLLPKHFCLEFFHVYIPMHRIPSFLFSSSLYYNFNIKLPNVVCWPPEPDISLWGWIDLPPENLDPCINLSLLGWHTIEPSRLYSFLITWQLECCRNPLIDNLPCTPLFKMS